MDTTTTTTYTYATLLETNEAEMEAWYYFIRYQGNEDALKNLQEQLERVDFYILEGLSTFDLELSYLVSEKTAKEMTKIDLNSHSFHRKFDGKLNEIDFNFRKKDGNETMICKVFDTLGYGQIEDYIDQEDIDEEDLVDVGEGDEDGSTTDGEEEEEETSQSEEEDHRSHRGKKVPKALLNSKIPNYIKTKKGRK